MQTPRTRVQRRPVHGVLLLDKPINLSSNNALQRVKWLLRAEKAGHTGTLDPLATGVLPLCFGAATKFSQLHLDADKTYETTIRLGIRTSTADAEGEIIEKRPVRADRRDVSLVLKKFTGRILQIPPMHSALKKDGKSLYEYARAGQSVERTAREVNIHEMEILDLELGSDAPSLTLRVRCSKGTYIRTLGEDIGEALGCGGHLTMLRRVCSGPFHLKQSISLTELETMDEPKRLAQLLPLDCLLQDHPKIILNEEEGGRFLSGMRRRGPWADADRVSVYAQPETLLGTGHVKATELIPGRLLNPVEIKQILCPGGDPVRASSVITDSK